MPGAGLGAYRGSTNPRPAPGVKLPHGVAPGADAAAIGKAPSGAAAIGKGPSGAAAGKGGAEPPRNIAPILPRVPPEQTPGGAPTGPPSAGMPSSGMPPGNIAYSTELPTPLGMAEVQIVGLSLALAAALIALRRPAYVPVQRPAVRKPAGTTQGDADNGTTDGAVDAGGASGISGANGAADGPAQEPTEPPGATEYS